ncbi:MAG: T9SS type A sorting domain-containing protein, partial [Bacteroidota bacterium]
ASSGAAGDLTYLVSPCIDLSALTAPQLSFWYHMYGSTIDTLFFDVYVNGTWIEDLYHLGGQQQATQTSPWLQATISLIGYENLDKFRFRARRGSSYYGDIAVDDVNIEQAPDFDISMDEWVMPYAGCGLTSSESISVQVINVGALPQDSIMVGYTIDGGSTVIGPEYITDTIQPGDTLIYTFTTPADFSAYITYNCMAFIMDPNDVNNLNDTIAISIGNAPLISAFPYFTDFETPSGWIAGGTGSSWQLGTPAGAVIVGAYSGSNSWMTNLTTYYNNSEGSYVIGPCFDFSSLLDPVFEMKAWWNSESGYDGAALQYSLNGGATWVTVGAYLDPGNWYTDNSVDGLFYMNGNYAGWAGTGPGQWVTVKHDLTGLAGLSDVKLRIAFGSDPSVNSYDGFAFDNVMIYDKPTYDLTVIEWVGPVSGDCGAGMEDVILAIVNAGTLPQSNFDVSYSVDGGTSWITETIAGPINPGDTLIHTFSTQADFSATGSHYCIGNVPNAGDQNHLNDSLFYTFVTLPTISTYPYFQNFETISYWTTGGSGGTWQLGTPAGTTIIGAGSGVNSWMTGLNVNYNDNDASWVIGPCFDFSSLIAPIFEMKAWWNTELDYDGAVLQYSLDDGISWVTVGNYGDPNNWYSYNSVYAMFNLTGDYDAWAGNTMTDWVTVKHDLTGLGGQPNVKLRVLFASDGSVNYDGFAFDDVMIYDTPDFDLAVTDWLYPLDGCPLTPAENVTIQITNNGLDTITNFLVSFSVDGGTSWVPDETVPGPIYPGTTLDYTFTATADFSSVALYDCYAAITDPNDEMPYNDTLNVQIDLFAVSVLPFAENFEGATTGAPGVLPAYWSTASNSTYRWHVRSGTTPTTGTGPQFDHTLGNTLGKYVYTEADNGFNGDTAYLYMPCTDLSGYTNPQLTFWYHMFGTSIDTLSVDVHVGGAWVNDIFTIGGQQQTSTNSAWLQAFVDLTSYTSADEIRFRAIRGNGTSGDISLDDINIYEPYYDAGISDVSGPLSACVMYNAMHIVVRVKNFGTIQFNAGDTILVAVEFDGAAAVIEPCVLTAALMPNATVYYVTAAFFNFLTLGPHTVVAYTLLPGDYDNMNDTITEIITHYGQPNFSFGPDIITSQPDTVVLDAGTWSSYLWSDASTGQTLNVLAEDTFCVTVTDANGCTATDCIYVGNQVGISIATKNGWIKVYPNPSEGLFNVMISQAEISDVSIEVMDVRSAVVYSHKQENVLKLEKQIDLRKLPAGVYYLKLLNAGEMHIEKIVIR